MRVIIIGNGAAANQAAETIQETCSDIEVSLYGQEEYPLYSACALPDYLAGWIPRHRLFLPKPDKDGKPGVKIMLNSPVEEIDAENKRILVNHQWAEYDNLIIATGSRSVIPPLPGNNLAGNYVLKTVADADAILAGNPMRIVVIGAGNIGVEVAEVMKLKGCEVTLVEWMARILPRNFDDLPAALIKEILEANGINIYTGEKVVEVQGKTCVEGVVTDKRFIPCDTAIWAAGVKQNTELAVRAGIATGALGGIIVNRFMQTNKAGVFACGDCIETFDIVTGQPVLSLLWSSAKRQAEIAALNSCGREVEYEGAFNFILEDIFEQTCLAMGLNLDAAEALSIPVTLREHHEEKSYVRYLMSGNRLVGMQAVNAGAALGPFMYIMKSGKSVDMIRAVVDNPALLITMPWYVEAVRIGPEGEKEMKLNR